MGQLENITQSARRIFFDYQTLRTLRDVKTFQNEYLGIGN
jgi:hypothetical protein